MPSKSAKTFTYNMDDVHRLVQAYEALKPTGQGKRGLGHLTRSCIVTLCACWEQYIEDVIVESVEFIRQQAKAANDMPLKVRKVISKRVKADKHELKPLELAGEGWRDMYLAFAKDAVGSLHSPKTANVQKLLENYLGFDQEIESVWSCGRTKLDKLSGFETRLRIKAKLLGNTSSFGKWVHPSD